MTEISSVEGHAGNVCQYFEEGKCLFVQEEVGLEAKVQSSKCEMCLQHEGRRNVVTLRLCSSKLLREARTREALNYAAEAKELQKEGQEYAAAGILTQQDLKKYGLDYDGFGTFLHGRLERWGFKITKTCTCMSRIRMMNARGDGWCRNHLSTVVMWLQQEASRRGAAMAALGAVAVRRYVDRQWRKYCKMKKLKTE